MSTRERNTGITLLTIIVLPIIVQFAHILYHHVDLHHLTSNLLSSPYHHSHDNDDKESEHCNICEYEFASFDVPEINFTRNVKLPVLETYYINYKNLNSFFKGNSKSLRAPPSLFL